VAREGGKSLLGRTVELAALDRVLDAARSGSADTLVLTGAPGIGKTTLLDAAWLRATDFERVRIAGREAESDLAWSGLASFLLACRDWDSAALAALREVVDGARRSLVSVGSALHALIVRRSERAPVLLAIDDAQWLDPPSADAIAFAVNRFAADRIAVIVTQRPGQAPRFARAVERAVDGLGRDQARALVRSRWTLPAEVVDRCVDLTGGNPLALLHVCDALSPDQRKGREPIEAVATLPARLAAVFAAKLAELPAATRRALAVVAAGGEIERLADVLDAMDTTPADLAAAEETGIVSLDGPPRLAHPLWSAAILDAVDPSTRRRVHRVLAAHTADPDRAALHRAAGADRADEGVARDLDALATRLIARGLPAIAARAWTDAARLSESADARLTREVSAARAFWDAGMPDAARAILERTIPELVDPRARAGAVLLRNQIRAFTEDARGASVALRAEADRVRGCAPDLEFPLLAAAAPAALLAADVPLGLELSARAAAAAGSDEVRSIGARALRGYAAVHLGDGSDLEEIRILEALGDVSAAAIPDDQIEMVQLAGYVLLLRERWGDAEHTLRAVIAMAARRGLSSTGAFAHATLAELDYRRGRWLDALTGATVDIALSETIEGGRATLGLAVAAHVLAHLGDAEQCSHRAAEALRSAEARGLASIAAFARAALGASALARGDTARAVEELDAVWAIRQRGGVAEPGVVWYHGDYVEALIAADRRKEAAGVVREVGRIAEATGGRWAATVATRGRALLSRGSARDAIAAAVALDAPFEIARTRLALVEHGCIDARSADLEAALATFERLGARPWAARARAASGATGESAASLAQQLTDAELRVAMLVGRGATNAAASEQLVLSVRTVDAHLRSIFRKLGLKSRSELVLRVATETGRR
jgi:DNA-binding CsgD family transcriptional regulator